MKLTIVERTNHFTIMNGWVYQDCWVRLADGTIDFYAIPDHKLGAA